MCYNEIKVNWKDSAIINSSNVNNAMQNITSTQGFYKITISEDNLYFFRIKYLIPNSELEDGILDGYWDRYELFEPKGAELREQYSGFVSKAQTILVPGLKSFNPKDGAYKPHVTKVIVIGYVEDLKSEISNIFSSHKLILYLLNDVKIDLELRYAEESGVSNPECYDAMFHFASILPPGIIKCGSYGFSCRSIPGIKAPSNPGVYHNDEKIY